MTAALMGRGLRVHTLKLELLLGKDVLRRTLCRMCAGHTGGGGGGGLFGGSKGGKSCKPRDAGDMSTALKRFNGLFDLLTTVHEKLKIRFHVVVHKFHTFGYAVYVVDRAQERVISLFIISANSKGFDQILGDPSKGDFADANNGDVTQIQYMRLAEYIVRKL